MVGGVPFQRLCHHSIGHRRAPPDEFHFEHFRCKKGSKSFSSPPKTSAAETGQMSSVETGQMSAVDTGQMSAAETGQMSSVARADICLVATHNVDVSEVSIVTMSQCSSRR